ncbi:MAG: S8 family peptidase [Flavobacteriales bacterium]|nr:S8 family peptidase [Flavobacteriales bacterium]
MTSTGHFQGSNLDVIASRFSITGGLEWELNHDESGNIDQSIDFQFAGNGNLNVIGLAQDVNEDYGLLTLEYSIYGNLINSIYNSFSTSMDQPLGIRVDGNDKYIYGNKINNNANSDFCLGKLDQYNNLNWTTTFDFADDDDFVNDIQIDNLGNVWMLGYGNNGEGGKDMLILKVDSAGNQLDTIEFGMVSRDDEIEGQKLFIDEDHFFTAGTLLDATSGKKGFFVFSYDEYMKIEWTTFWNEPNSTPKGVANIFLDENNQSIVLYGFVENLSNNSYLQIEWQWIKRPIDKKILGSGLTEYVEGELIVEVNPEYVKTDFANNKELTFGNLYDALDSSFVDSIDSKIGSFVSLIDIRVVKINPEFTTIDTLSLARTGNWIPMPPLYNQFVFVFYSAIDEIEISGFLNELEEINYSEINVFPTYMSTPNDSELVDDQQASLVPSSTDPGSHIGMDGAWDINTGADSIKIGIFDSGVQWLHHDLTPGRKEDPDFSKCLGFDFETSPPESFIRKSLDFKFDAGDHGTNVAGIAGATSNNLFGIAGVAGGNWANSSYGCPLYVARLSKVTSTGPRILPISNHVTALYKFGVQSNTGIGEGVHVMNHSYGLLRNFPWPFDFGHNDTSVTSFAKAFQFAARNGVVQVAARGNEANAVSSFPACYDDSWVINVGGYTRNRDVHPQSSFDKGVDIIGPMHEDQICTIHPYNPTQINYSFNGTSAAAPHVSGVAALVLSEFNDKSPLYENLSGEDVEYLLQKYTYNSNCSSYPDPKCGWGALNAAAILEHIEYPYYRIDHFPKGGEGKSFISSTSAGVVSVKLVEAWNGIPKGTYTATARDILVQVSHSIRSADQLLGYWLRPNFCTGLQLAPASGTIILPAIQGGQLVSCNTTVAVIKTRIYEISYGGNTYPYPGTWNQLDYSYGVHLYDSNATNGDFHTEVIELKNNHSLRVYPNPTRDKINISFSLEQPESIGFRLIDARGVEYWQKQSSDLMENRYKYEIDMSNLPVGVYTLIMSSTSFYTSRKIVKQ